MFKLSVLELSDIFITIILNTFSTKTDSEFFSSFAPTFCSAHSAQLKYLSRKKMCLCKSIFTQIYAKLKYRQNFVNLTQSRVCERLLPGYFLLPRQTLRRSHTDANCRPDCVLQRHLLDGRLVWFLYVLFSCLCIQYSFWLCSFFNAHYELLREMYVIIIFI